MDADIKRLISQSIEIEGLLRILADRDNDDALSLLAQKVDIFTADIKTVLCRCATQQQCEEIIAEDSNDAPLIVDEIEEQDDDKDIYVGDEISITTDDDNPTVDADITELITDNSNDEVVETQDDNQTQYNQNETVSLDDAPIMTDRPLVESDELPTAGDDIRVDELFSRREARDLKRAFTLNDKFRFRRSLFNSNDSLFADTLNTLMAMKSYDEATEYLYGDLKWNEEDEDVKDFMNIVKNHFAGR